MTLNIDIKDMIIAMKMIRRAINILLIVDIGIVIFTLLSRNYNWFINSQIGFISSSLVIFASMFSYKKMINSRLDSEIVVPEDNRDTIDKIEDPYNLYVEDKDIIKEEKKRLKDSRRSILEVLRDSKSALSIYRLGAYFVLILGFFYLNSSNILDIVSYLFSLAIPPIIIIFSLFYQP